MTRLQRINKHLKERDWFTVFVELVILIVGVYFGIQAANWNEARQDRADEAAFLKQLHKDIVAAETLANRIGRFRVARREYMESALDVLFERADRDELSAPECQAVYTAGFVNMPFIDIGSFNELSSSGRIDIIRDDELRGALLQLQQAITQSNRTVQILSGIAFSLGAEYPELIQLIGVVDKSGDRPEIRSVATCDTRGMRASQAFLNKAASNIDLYDAFFRDGFEPWQEAITAVRERTDVLLGLSDNATQ